jgi:hypothetical protein
MTTIAQRGLIVLVALLGLVRLAAADREKLVVVVAKTSSVTNISRVDLKRSFLGDPITVGGARLAPFNAEPNSDERAGFDLGVLGMTPEEIGRFWVDRKVRGQGAAPRSLPAIHLAKVIAKVPGAIGYLRVDQLTADVKAITVDGVAHDSARYTIRTR